MFSVMVVMSEKLDKRFNKKKLFGTFALNYTNAGKNLMGRTSSRGKVSPLLRASKQQNQIAVKVQLKWLLKKCILIKKVLKRLFTNSASIT